MAPPYELPGLVSQTKKSVKGDPSFICIIAYEVLERAVLTKTQSKKGS
jgi:hypothetical protein